MHLIYYMYNLLKLVLLMTLDGIDPKESAPPSELPMGASDTRAAAVNISQPSLAHSAISSLDKPEFSALSGSMVYTKHDPLNRFTLTQVSLGFPEVDLSLGDFPGLVHLTVALHLNDLGSGSRPWIVKSAVMGSLTSVAITRYS